MDVIYSLIPGMMFFGLIFLAVLIWAVKKGQYEDMEGNASRILFDDDTMIYPDKTTSHSTRLSKDDSQVAGYDKGRPGGVCFSALRQKTYCACQRKPEKSDTRRTKNVA